MLLYVHLVIYLLLGFCKGQTDKPLKNPRMFTLLPETLTGSPGQSSEGLLNWTNSSKPNAIPTATGFSTNLMASSTAPIKCQAQNSSCTTEEPVLSTEKSLCEECILWDSSCSGNTTKAMDTFFNDTIYPARDYLSGFSQNSTGDDMCGQFTGVKRRSKLESWMRSPECLSTAISWQKSHPHDYEYSFKIWDSCCGRCLVAGVTVDIFYWPDPNVDDSCLSIIDNTAHPLDMGATVTLVDDVKPFTYWGCTLRTPISGESIVTTATLQHFENSTFKISKVNPWDPPDCFNVSKPHVAPHAKTMPSKAIWSGNPSEIPPSMTQPDNRVTTAVLDGYTFSSPSVYARFHNVGFEDLCGVVTVVDTMLSFAPGELSTIAGPIVHTAKPDRSDYVTRAFNPTDLPCPPQSVMEQAWYSPEPHVPYRPLVALPEQIRKWFPGHLNFFIAPVDPPYALSAQNAITPNDPKNETPAQPEEATRGHALTLDSDPLVPLPTATPVPVPKGAEQTSTPKQISSPSNRDHSADPNQANPENNNNAASDAQPPDPQKSEDARQGSHGISQQAPSQPSQTGTPSLSAPKANADPGDTSGSGKVDDNTPGRPQFSGAHGSGPDPEPEKSEQYMPKQDAQPPIASLAIGLDHIRKSSSGIQINDRPVSPDSPPVSLKDGSLALIDKSGQNVVIGDKIFQISPTSTTEGASWPVSITLPNGANAVPLPSIHENGKPADLNANGNSQGKNDIEADDSKSRNSLLSIYGTTLTPGGAPVTLATDSAGAPLTLSLDPNNHIIYNPTVHTLPPLPSQSRNPSDNPPVGPVTTEIPGHQPLVVLPNGQGVSIAGTTLYPSSLLTGLTVNNGQAEITLSGTRISLLGTSALVIGSSTVTLPTPAAALTGDAVPSAGKNTTSSGTQTNQGTEIFTGGGAASSMLSLQESWCGRMILLLITVVVRL